MAGPAYYPSSELSKPICQSCCIDLGEFKDNNYDHYRMNNKAVFFCGEDCLKYYMSGDQYTKMIMRGKHIHAITVKIFNTED